MGLLLQVSLGYPQLKFPIGILLVGILISIFIASIEKYAFTYQTEHFKLHYETEKKQIPNEYQRLKAIFPKFSFGGKLTKHQVETLKMFRVGVKEYLEELREIKNAQKLMHMD